MNATLHAFGYPETLVHESEHWALLVRPKQVTLGSMVLASKHENTEFATLPTAAFTDLKAITTSLESSLKALFAYDKINYLMLMMVDPHVHFHVFPRYESARTFESTTYEDHGWPGPPNLKQTFKAPPSLTAHLLGAWLP